MSLAQWSLIELPKIADAHGNLTFVEGVRHVFFEISREWLAPNGEILVGVPNSNSIHRLVAEKLVCQVER